MPDLPGDRGPRLRKHKSAARKWTPTSVDEARSALGGVADFLWREGNRPPSEPIWVQDGAGQYLEVELGGFNAQLRWAALALKRYLADRQRLAHAFGLVRPRGNQGRLRKAKQYAATVDGEGLTLVAARERFGLEDMRNLRRTLGRGREAAAAEEQLRQIDAHLDGVGEEKTKQRKAAVKRHNRRHGIKFGPPTAG